MKSRVCFPFTKYHVIPLILVILAACSSPQEPEHTVLTGATFYDGKGGVIENGTIVIADGRIECMGADGECTVPMGAKVINTEGSYITPGLTDTHMHFAQTGFFDGRPDAMDITDVYPLGETIAYQRMNPERYYRSYLCSGVTSVYDVGGMSWSIDFQQEAEELQMSPHVAAAGPLLTPAQGAPFDLPSDKTLVPLNSVEAGIQTVQYLSDLGSTGIKFWQLRADDPEYMERVEVAAAEIERKGNMMIAHATTLEQAKAALQNNTKLLVHSVADVAVDEEFIEMALENGTYYNPTLIVSSGYILAYRAAAGIEDFDINDPNGCVDDRTRTMMESADQFSDHPRLSEALLERLQAFDREEDRVSEQQLQNLKTLYDAGVKIVVGTDAGNPGTLHGISIYEEMEAMQSAGILPEDLIVMATKNGAEAMRRGDDFGTLEPGKIANLIMMDADPGADIANMRTLTHVMIKGNWMEVEEFGSN